MMDPVLNSGMCRCCASEGTFKNVMSKYHWMGDEEIYADMLRECFDITLCSSDGGLQSGICEVCITQLRNAANFKKQVQQTEEQFKKRLQDNMFKANIVKLEMGTVEDDDGNLSDNNLSEDFVAEFEVPIKKESEEPKSKKRGSTRASTSRAKKPKLEDGESSAKSLSNVKSEFKVSRPLRSRLKMRRGVRIETGIEVPELEKHRANIRMILQCSNATPIRCRGGIGYACCFCADQFPDPADLKTHSLEQHSDKCRLKFMNEKMMYSFLVKLDITSLRCKICEDSIDSLDELKNHLIKVHQKTIYTDVNNHILPFKFEDNTLRCTICSSTFNKFKVLLEHMNTHYRNYICDVCDAGFVNRNILMNHTESHKLGVFQCSYCEKVFDTYRKKKSHEKSVHIHLNMLNKCGYCNEKFKDYRLKDKHMAQVHGIAILQLKCQACEKTFDNKTQLTIHTKRDHLMERRHKCLQCDKKFFKTSELTEHMVKHTGEKMFHCSVCLKSYGRRKTLTEHMRIHADDRRFKCEHCGQAFVQKCSWKGHLRAKHGDLIQ